MVATLPPFLTDETAPAVLGRLLVSMAAWDTTEGSFVWDLCAAFALEVAGAGIWMQQAEESTFPQTAQGDFLDMWLAVFGLSRNAGAGATGTVTFGGTPGTVVPAGTRVAAATVPGSAIAAVTFTTLSAATIGAGLTVDTPVQAVLPSSGAGAAGNVGAGSIRLILDTVPGVTAVVNSAPTTGGRDVESDDLARARLLDRMAHPPGGGTATDYVVWSLDVDGVGSAYPVLLEDESGAYPVNGNVSVYLATTDGLPADQATIDRAQTEVAAPYVASIEAEAMLVYDAHGVSSIDRGDDSGTSVQMDYSAGGPGQLRHDRIDLVLPARGVWSVRPRLAVASTVGSGIIARLGVFNLTTGDWAHASQDGTAAALRDLAPSAMRTTYARYPFDVYWNGTDQLQTLIVRQPTDTLGSLLVDDVLYRSVAGRQDRPPGLDGKSPAGARVTFKPMCAVPVDVSVTLVVAPGADFTAARTAALAAVQDVVRAAALSRTDHTLYYGQVMTALRLVPGVAAIQGLLLAGGLADVSVPLTCVPVLTSITTATWDDVDAVALDWDRVDLLALDYDNIDRIVE